VAGNFKQGREEFESYRFECIEKRESASVSTAGGAVGMPEKRKEKVGGKSSNGLQIDAMKEIEELKSEIFNGKFRCRRTRERSRFHRNLADRSSRDLDQHKIWVESAENPASKRIFVE